MAGVKAASFSELEKCLEAFLSYQHPLAFLAFAHLLLSLVLKYSL